MSQRKTILQLDCKEAREFFLKEESYCNFNLPPYIQCEPLLQAINQELNKKEKPSNLIESIKQKNLQNEVNYKILNNKNGKYDWRIFELINPIFYVCLVREITNEKNWQFLQKHFQNKPKNAILCHTVFPYNLKIKKVIKPSKYRNGGIK